MTVCLDATDFVTVGVDFFPASASSRTFVEGGFFGKSASCILDLFFPSLFFQHPKIGNGSIVTFVRIAIASFVIVLCTKAAKAFRSTLNCPLPP